MIFLFVFATAFLVALGITPLAARLAPRLGTMDQPAARRIHHVPMPRFGGLPLFVAFFAAVAVSLVYPRSDQYELLRLGGLFGGAVVLFFVGAYDDHRELKALPQLLAQIIAASMAVGAGVLIREVNSPLGGLLKFETWFAVLFTVFWIVGMANTVNWLDGIDGLAGGVVAIAGVFLFIHALRQEQYSIALLAAALVGAVLGFLPFNFSPARIFLGTAGALVLGYALSVLSIIGAARVAFALLLLGIPIMDVAWQIVSRVRLGTSPFSPTRTHLHHRLLDAGLSQRTIVLLYYGFTAISGLLALVLPLGFYKLIALVVIGFGALLLLIRMSQRADDRPPTTDHRQTTEVNKIPRA
ncbi:MAG: undecaprenyl/decaprenyl-phosphate alpha-N-acetylglucosaminyl 1-phosphate transferase [Chloroflexi bacterium]|nr:undecaprenyl/decaprenyl-phosphate alpha-N-acetylglucosaminyl 1-phosphate transferase [Chloroflexota bacterium]